MVSGVACGDEDGGTNDSYGDGNGADDGADGSDGDGGGDDGGSGDGGDAGDDGGGGPKLDVSDDGTGGPGDGEAGCKKVDFLFVIDNSGSMQNEQQQLVDSFPGFIETIKLTLENAQDYQIMVVDTDAYVFQACETLFCPFFANTCPPAFGMYQCGVTQPDQCEDVLGGGVTHPKGLDASNTDCAFSSGKRFMDIGQADLVGAFSCAAKVGTGSTLDPEKPMEAMVAAVSDTGDAADCNEGFLRDDAILVVTFITDEDDSNGDSNGTVDGWHQALVAAKNGDESAVVVLGLFGDNDQPNPVCDPLDMDSNNGAEPSVRLREFVESWGPNGFSGSVCAPSYNEFFQEAVDIIDTTCDDFVPPG